MRRQLSRSLLLLLILATGVISAAFAQDYDEGDYGGSRAVLSLYFKQDGTARVDFYSSAVIDSIAGLHEALGSALHCKSAAFQPPAYPNGSEVDPERREQYRRAQRQVARHQLNATCSSLAQRDHLRTRVDIELDTVLAVLKESHFDGLNLVVTANDQNIQVDRQSLRPASNSRFGMLSFQIPVTEPNPSIHLQWGHRTQELAWPLGAAVAFIIFPSVLILWMRSRALHLHATDRAGAWFSYIRTQHLCLTGALLVWIGGGYSTRDLLSSILSATWGEANLRVAVLSLLYVLIPPLFVLLVSVLASYRVMVEVRQVSWGLREFLELQVAHVGVMLFPILGIYSGIQLFGNFTWLAITVVVLSFLSLAAAVRLRRKLTGGYPEPVTSGNFHDRIHLLARRAGVPLKGIFVLPSGRIPVANAFAASNGVVMVTDYILQKLNRREVEAVTAHEIGHLQYNHPGKLSGALVGVVLVPIVFQSIFTAIVDIAASLLPQQFHWTLFRNQYVFLSPALDFSIAGLCLLAFYAISRRFERIADARSVTLTDDPEALITAFAKLSVLNLTPMQWGRASGALTTHPSTLKRIRRIAEVGKVSEDRLQQLLTEPQLETTTEAQVELFDLPLPAFARVYPTHQQLRKASANFLLLVGISTAVPTIFAYLGAAFQKYELGLLVAGVIATFAIYLTSVRWRIVDGRDKLRKRFLSHFAKLYPTLDLTRSRLTGYSPDAWPRFYYVQSYWDTGLLVPSRDGLLFLGDEAKFLLPYSAIQELVFDQGISSWWKFHRTYLRWSAGESRGVMNLLSLEPCSLWSIESANRRLHGALEEWRTNAKSFATLPAEVSSLRVPTPVQLASKTPREVYPLKAITKLVALAFLSGVFVFYRTQSIWPLIYIPAVVFLLRFIESAPYRRHKDRPLSREWTPPGKVVENKAPTQSTN